MRRASRLGLIAGLALAAPAWVLAPEGGSASSRCDVAEVQRGAATSAGHPDRRREPSPSAGVSARALGVSSPDSALLIVEGHGGRD